MLPDVTLVAQQGRLEARGICFDPVRQPRDAPGRIQRELVVVRVADMGGFADL